MKTRHLHSTIGVIVASALLGLAQHAQAAGECTLANVAGDYGYTTNGTVVTPPVGPFTALGHVTLTSSGTFTGAQTTTVAGNFFDETVSGDYAVNLDCTGEATVFVYRGGTLARTSRIALIWDDNRKEFRSIFLTPGTNITISGRRM